jgi:hypothetical protein
LKSAATGCIAWTTYPEYDEHAEKFGDGEELDDAISRDLQVSYRQGRLTGYTDFADQDPDVENRAEQGVLLAYQSDISLNPHDGGEGKGPFVDYSKSAT